MADRKKMLLAVMASGAGSHIAAWRHPETDAGAGVGIAAHVEMARLAERGLFHMYFVADTPAARTSKLDIYSRMPIFMNQLEPLTLLSALAVTTRHIGLGGTVSASFYEPYNLARQFASLDQISGGRSAWNIVTSANDYAAQNFGLDRLPPHGDRYRRADEFTDIVLRLWDSWEDDAFIRDKESGYSFDPRKQHAVHHEGPYFKIHGALNVQRSPQGRPVIIQAGASEAGMDFAAKVAELIFGANETPAESKAFYDQLKARVGKFGRSPEALRLLAGMPVILGESEQEAEDKYQTLQALIHPDVGRARLSMDLEADLSGLPLDEPVPEELIPASANFHKKFYDNIVNMIRIEKLTLRQMYLRYERGRRTLRGTPAQIADALEEWHAAGACDGFMMMFPMLKDGLGIFVDQVVPELQRRGLLRTGQDGVTLRDQLGFARPPHPAARAAPERAAE
ncbi:LLM class flavin-dependent oxidoreductase [Roseococcus sp. SYP-B2431]|uniref:LLM class flavin-dependent oxidoreductase n=1 Tax=Roseococcus sp. SYP-B2431 TaxID=2496640 RepID=UPI0010392F76|nr:LLM class flavin-dependent oxidoreductase [Roseococcus sp. SYP-B2431]TCH98219.1 LLM class flavin-dependent oxidoreductase [Roseococcus sp. SYP-B2431]